MRIEFSQHDYETLLLTLGFAAGGLLAQGDRALFYRVLDLANRINRDNPNWTQFALPPRELWIEDNEELTRYFFSQIEKSYQAWLNKLGKNSDGCVHDPAGRGPRCLICYPEKIDESMQHS